MINCCRAGILLFEAQDYVFSDFLNSGRCFNFIHSYDANEEHAVSPLSKQGQLAQVKFAEIPMK